VEGDLDEHMVVAVAEESGFNVEVGDTVNIPLQLMPRWSFRGVDCEADADLLARWPGAGPAEGAARSSGLRCSIIAERAFLASRRTVSLPPGCRPGGSEPVGQAA